MKREDEGFTLVELLLSMAILTIVISSLSSALIVFLRNGADALRRDDHSGGIEILGSYVDRDIASASAVSTSSTTGANGCQTGSTANLLVLTWRDYVATSTAPSPSPSATVLSAVYRLVTDPEGGLQLQRYSCSGTAVAESSTLVRGLASAATAVANVAVSGSCASGSALTLTLASYSTDSTTPYTFAACTTTRISQ